jgi:hypothetical protein
LLSHERFAQAAAQQRRLRLLFSWIYDVSSLLAIILFGAGFVAVFWLGLLLLRPFVRRLLPQERGLNATLTMYLQYFGIIYGLLLGLLAVGAYQNHAETRRSVGSPRPRHSQHFTVTSQVTPSHTAPISRRWCVNTCGGLSGSLGEATPGDHPGARWP